MISFLFHDHTLIMIKEILNLLNAFSAVYSHHVLSAMDEVGFLRKSSLGLCH